MQRETGSWDLHHLPLVEGALVFEVQVAPLGGLATNEYACAEPLCRLATPLVDISISHCTLFQVMVDTCYAL